MKTKNLFLAIMLINCVCQMQAQNECAQYFDQYVLTPTFTTGLMHIDIDRDTIPNDTLNTPFYMYYVDSAINKIFPYFAMQITPATYYGINRTCIYGAHGYAQPYHANNEITIKGIALAKLPCLGGVYILTNDIVGILDGYGNVIYQQTLDDTISRSTNANYSNGCPMYEVIFDSAINVSGNYYMFYSFDEDNVNNFETGFVLICIEYFKRDDFVLDYIMPQQEYLVRMQGTNSWITYSEFKSYTGYPYYGSGTASYYNNQDIDTVTDDLGIFPIVASSNVIDTDSNVLTYVDLKNAVSLFPNPAKNEVYVNSQYLIQDIDIYDQVGRMVLSKDIKAYKTNLDIKNLKQGTYIMNINTNNGKAKKKLVVK